MGLDNHLATRAARHPRQGIPCPCSSSSGSDPPREHRVHTVGQRRVCRSTAGPSHWPHRQTVLSMRVHHLLKRPEPKPSSSPAATSLDFSARNLLLDELVDSGGIRVVSLTSLCLNWRILTCIRNVFSTVETDIAALSMILGSNSSMQAWRNQMIWSPVGVVSGLEDVNQETR